MNKTASVLAFAIGVMSIIAGGLALRGWEPGYSVLPWLPAYNLIMGVLTLVPAVLIWTNHRYAMVAAIVMTGIHAIVLLLLLTVFRDVVAIESIRAMLFRLLIWLVVIGLLYAQARKKRAVST